VGAVKQKGGAVTIKIQYFGEKSLESSMKSVSKGGAAAPTSSAVDPPLDSEHLIIVAESSNNHVIVGFGSVIPSKQEIRAVYVDPAFAGESVGSKILSNLEELALLHGEDKLNLDSSLNANKFYSHHEYSMIERGTHRFNSGVIMNCVEMSNDLQIHQ
jgi:hypothetical protein